MREIFRRRNGQDDGRELGVRMRAEARGPREMGVLEASRWRMTAWSQDTGGELASLGPPPRTKLSADRLSPSTQPHPSSSTSKCWDHLHLSGE